MKYQHPFIIAVLAVTVLTLSACGVQNPVAQSDNSYVHCNRQYNFCIEYPMSVFPPPREGDDNKDLILSLYSEEYDLSLLLSAKINAQRLTFDQLYEKQMADWQNTYDDVNQTGSNIVDNAYDISATADGYHLYAKTVDIHFDGTLVNLRLKAGPPVNTVMFEDIKEKILIYPNK